MYMDINKKKYEYLKQKHDNYNKYNFDNITNVNNAGNNLNHDYPKKIGIEKISNIMSNKMTGGKKIDQESFEELCGILKSSCERHNLLLDEWYNEKYENDLRQLKKNNLIFEEFLNLLDKNSFFSIKNID